MDANLLRRFLAIANQFDKSHLTYDGQNVTIEGDESVYSSEVDQLDEMEEEIRKDKEEMEV